jgi:HlyD family secretion protein
MQTELHQLRIEKHHRAVRHSRTIWPCIVGGLVILVAGAVIAVMHGGAPTPTVKTIRVRLPEVTGNGGGADLVTLNATGYVTAAHKIELASKVLGKVAEVDVEMGDKIQKDQVLVRLEDEEYRARVAEQQGLLDNAKAALAELEAGSRPQETAQAQAMVDQAESELLNAQLNLDRLRAVEITQSVSKQQLDDAAALVRSRTALRESQRQALELSKLGPRKEKIDAQRATVRQLQGSLDLAMVQLNDTIIRAPFAATVLDRNVEVGEFVTTGFVGDKGAKGYVLSIADLNDLRVELDVSQNDIAKAALGQPASITTDAYPDHKYKGVVTLISPEANRQKATVLVRVKVLEPDDLIKPEMNATVAFFSSGKSSPSQPAEQVSAIRVPSSAVRDGAVFVVEEGKAVKRTITPGLTTAGGEVEIRKGLIGGEDLIIDPPDQLKDGDKVNAQTNKI